MGYRYEIGIAISQDCFEKHGEVLKQHTDRCDDIFLHDEFYYFYWEHRGWDTFADEDAKAFEDFVNEHFDDTKMIRIGDEDKDIEVTGGGEASLYFVRLVELPKKGKKKVDLDKLFEPASVSLMREVSGRRARNKKPIK